MRRRRTICRARCIAPEAFVAFAKLPVLSEADVGLPLAMTPC
jgi:hypothetical protein